MPDEIMGTVTNGSFNPTSAVGSILTYTASPVLEYRFEPWPYEAVVPMESFSKSSTAFESFSSMRDIFISQDSLVFLKLDERLFDCWRIDVDAITLKDRYGDLYTELAYGHEGAWVSRDKLPTDARPMAIRFNAKVDRPPTKPTRLHGFAFNVVINGVKQSIDPDIRNPQGD